MVLTYSKKREIEVMLSSKDNKITTGSQKKISDAFLDVAIICWFLFSSCIAVISNVVDQGTDFPMGT